MFLGPTCESHEPNKHLVKEQFELSNQLSDIWSLSFGAELSQACGEVDSGMSLYFGGEGHRVAQTAPIDMQNVKLV